jgi:hypothetical protein
MVDLEALRRVCAGYQCQVELEDLGTTNKERYMAVLNCPHRDYSKVAALEKEIRATWPEIDRVVLNITPPKS